MKSILITGANGFIGKKLVLQFANKNFLVYAIVKDIVEDIDILNHDNVKIIYSNLDDIENILSFVDCEIDYLFHLAWDGVCSLEKNNFLKQANNLQYTYNVLELTKKLKCKKFIGIGSVSEFGLSNEAINVKGAPAPSDYYAALKVAARYICEIYTEMNKIDFNWTYITSVYGKGRNDNNLITYTITSLLDGKKPKYTKLEQKWDYIHIDDVINALYLVALYGHNRKKYAIGNGENKFLKEYVEIIKNKINPDLEIEIGALPYKMGVIDNSIVDISELVKDTGYSSSISFADGIEDIIEYYRENKNG